MNPPALPNSGFRIRKLHVVLMLLLALPLFSVLGIASYFWLGTETKALRASVMANSTGHWHKKFAGNVGGFTTAVIRFGSRFFHLPPEARAGLDSLRSGECGVFELEG